jgi:1-acyl-sn-glycerol-3-phosphate acyltransferase
MMSTYHFQVYADWWYAWCLTYFMDTHRDVCIVLKKGLQWIPIVGWVIRSLPPYVFSSLWM